MRGRYQTLHHTDIHYLLQLIRQNPDYFLDELLRMLKTNRFISVHYTTIHDELVHAGVSQKRLQRIALERNEALHADFNSRMAQFSPEELGFIDDVSKDERTVGRHYGRSKGPEGGSSPQISTIHAWTAHVDCWSSFGRWICGGYISRGFIDTCSSIGWSSL